MSLPDFTTDAGLSQLEQALSTRAYLSGYTPSQADVTVFKAIRSPDENKYPHISRWYSHIASYEAEHSTLSGDASAAAAVFAGTTPAPAAAAEGGDDEDFELFGSDEEEDPEAERIKAQRVAEYNERKKNKPKAAQKARHRSLFSVVTLDVKPWDDETDMVALEKSVRGIEQDGLVWGLSKLVPIGYGVKKLQITLVIEDEKVSLDDLQEKIQEFEDYVQSSDIQAMQKL